MKSYMCVNFKNLTPLCMTIETRPADTRSAGKTHEGHAQIEQILVKFYTIFSLFSLFVRIRSDFRLSLLSSMKKQSLLKPSQCQGSWKIKKTFELNPHQEYEKKTVLPYSNQSSLIFERRKSYGKFSISIKLRWIRRPIKHENNEQNHLVTTIAYELQHMSRKVILYGWLSSSPPLQRADGRAMDQTTILQFSAKQLCLKPTCSRYEQIKFNY